MAKLVEILAGKGKYITVFLFLLYAAVMVFFLWLLGSTLYLFAIFMVLTWVLVAGLIVIQGDQIPSWGRFGKVLNETVIIYFIQLTLGLSRGLAVLYAVASLIALLIFTILVFIPDAVPGILPYPVLALLSLLSIIIALLLMIWLYKYTDKQIEGLRERIARNK